MIQLGLSGFYHDSAAALVIDGKVIAAIEEEKLSGIKHDSSFPFKAIEWILQYAHITIDEVDMVCWYEEPDVKYDRVKKTIGSFYGLKHPKLWNEFKKRWSETEGDIENKLKSIGYHGIITYTKHHLSHIAYSYYTSPFNEAVAISIDGVGEWDTIYAVSCRDNEFRFIESAKFPHSLGLVYSAITAYLGFKPNGGEYKVMGLAPYGDYMKYRHVFDKISYLEFSELLKINMEYFTWDKSDTTMFNLKLANLIGFEPRTPESKIEQHHMDLASALQKWYEGAFYYIVNHCIHQSDNYNLVLGGGSAYNGTANGKIQKHTSVRELWIPPAPSDAGSAIGACLYQWHNVLNNPKVIGGDNQSPYLGPEWDDIHLFNIISKNNKGLKIELMNNTSKLCKEVAKLINNGAVVGWFQGRTEFGARALGNRSILANPHLSDVRDRINKVVKKREMFRPFAPSVTFEDYEKYFQSEGEVPYMNQVVQVTKYKSIPSVTHVDNSARIQTVREEQNPLYYKLLKAFEKVSGTPILLNTSFNLRGHTMTNEPQKAIWTFKNSDMDYLVLGNYLISKV
jgi:carbamoyltransferase